MSVSSEGSLREGRWGSIEIQSDAELSLVCKLSLVARLASRRPSEEEEEPWRWQLLGAALVRLINSQINQLE